MLKKSLLSIAIATSMVGVSGCDISSTTGNQKNAPDSQIANQQAVSQQGVMPVFDPVGGKVPSGIDLIMAKAGASDGTADTGRAGTPFESPVSNAIDRLDGGIGVTTPIDIPMTGSIDGDQSFAGKVFLIKLANEDVGGDIPLQALDIKDILGQGLSAVDASQPAFGSDYRVEAISVDGGTNNVLRVLPLTPLEPKTKYIVAVTTGVTDADGDNISVNNNYASIIGGDPLVAPSLENVKDALNAWTQLANGYFAAAVQASQLPAVPTIASVGAFTTISTDSVLSGAVLPELAASSFIEGAIAKSVKDGVRASDELDQTDFTAVWTAIETTFAGKPVSTLQTLAGNALSSLDLSTPEARTPVFLPTALDTNAATTSGGLGLPAQALIYQGVIDLPYYLTAPATNGDDVTGATDVALAANAVQNTSWSSDTDVGDALETILATAALVEAGAVSQDFDVDTPEEEAALAAAKADLTIPPQDLDGSTNVNGSFPFVAKTSDVKAPVMVTIPDLNDDGTPDCGSAVASLCPVVVYVHGITGSRGNAIPASLALATAQGVGASKSFATVAIDLPLHGIAPLTSAGSADPFLGLSFDTGTFATAAGQVSAFDGISERHFGYGTGADGVLTPLVYDDPETETDEALAAAGPTSLKSNYSGAAFINLGNFMVTRDLMRQAVMDQLNLLASLGAMDFDGDPGADFDTTQVHIIGHSLGGIIAPTVVKMANTMLGAGAPYNAIVPQVDTLSLVTPGGQLARLIENSPNFAGQADASGPVNNSGEINENWGLLGQLAANGIPQGSSNFETFMNVFQATIDGVDPITYAAGTPLAAQPIMAIEVVGDGGTQTIDGVEINKPDQTIPNSADTGETWQGANPSPLAGTEPLISANGLGLGDFTDTNIGAATYNTDSRVAIRLKKGTHTSVLTTAGDVDADEGTVEKETYDNTKAAQDLIYGALIDYIDNNGASVTVDNSADVIAAP